MKIAEIFGIDEGPLYEEMRRNILHINGADHARLRSLVNPALVAARGRALPPGDARLPRGAARRDGADGDERAASSSRRSPSPTRRW